MEAMRREVVELRALLQSKDQEIARLRSHVSVLKDKGGLNPLRRAELLSRGHAIRQRLIAHATSSSTTSSSENRNIGSTKRRATSKSSDNDSNAVPADHLNGQSTTSTDKVTTTRRTSEDGKWRADDNNDDVKRSNERGNENDDRRSPVSVHAFVERCEADAGEGIERACRAYFKNPKERDRREMEKLKSKARLLEEENHFLHSMLSDKEHQVKTISTTNRERASISRLNTTRAINLPQYDITRNEEGVWDAQHENTVLSRLVKEGERRVGQVREEASLLSDTLKASLQSLSGEMKKQVARLREEREMLTSSLRTALDRAALENTALRSQLAACGVSVDSILQGVVEKMMEEEKQREEAKQKELLRQQGAATPNE
eukprot:jgi/Bigna1/75963/fgenesh1_pg.38_\